MAHQKSMSFVVGRQADYVRKCFHRDGFMRRAEHSFIPGQQTRDSHAIEFGENASSEAFYPIPHGHAGGERHTSSARLPVQENPPRYAHVANNRFSD
jgi:hypothetical protein